MTLDELHGRGGRRSPRRIRGCGWGRRYAATVNSEAERIVRQLAGIDLEAAVQAVERMAPPLMEILAAARNYRDQHTVDG